ncbi:MAG: DNA polymerase IV [Ruminococcaceae bacterium]|nr:DNA polymerase IV [Oscillospiraceae bacterium]
MERTVLHVDCNSFFASVEMVFNPSLASVPMAVAGDAEARHGIILAKNELAKAKGVVTAETIWSAKKKCPALVLVPPHHEEYARFSRRFRQILARYTDMIEPFGIDEAWMDVTGSRALFGDGVTIAERIRREVKAELGITVSVGVSFNKIFAKLGSDYKKPDAVTVIGREDVARIVHPLPADAMIFVGKQTAKLLLDMGIRTIGDLASASPAFLQAKLGKAGAQLSICARGEDESPVANFYDKTDAKSVSAGMTFRHDLTERDEFALGIHVLAEDVAYRLRKTGMKCTTVSVTLKDYLLKSTSKQTTLSFPTHLAGEISDTALSLATDAVRRGVPVRMISVAATGLLHAEDAVTQMSLFEEKQDEKREKRERLEETVISLRDRFGRTAVQSGSVLGNDIGIEGERKEKS